MRNPPWVRDELILALELYSRHNPVHISKTHEEIVALSDLLNRLPLHEHRPDAAHFRNPNGVYMKLCNFLRFDPSYSGSGLTRGNRLEEEVWDDFANDLTLLGKIAGAIRDSVGSTEPVRLPELDADEHALEGQVLLRLHKYRERDPSLATKKKRWAMRKYGRLSCEVCAFDFKETYGELGESISGGWPPSRSRCGRIHYSESAILGPLS